MTVLTLPGLRASDRGFVGVIQDQSRAHSSHSAEGEVSDTVTEWRADSTIVNCVTAM